MADSVTVSPGEATAEPPQDTLVIDENRQEAFWCGRRLDLSLTEFALLACLHRRAGQNVTYESLLQEVWGASLDQGGSLGQVRSTVKRLRQKLAATADHACRLVSVRGVGYRLDLPADRDALPAHSRRSMALRAGLALIIVLVLAAVAAGWPLLRQGHGDPTILVWYRQQRVPIGVLWTLRRGQHCCQGPDGALYCFDTPEERAAAMEVLLRNAVPQEPDQPHEPEATPVP